MVPAALGPTAASPVRVSITQRVQAGVLTATSQVVQRVGHLPELGELVVEQVLQAQQIAAAGAVAVASSLARSETALRVAQVW